MLPLQLVLCLGFNSLGLTLPGVILYVILQVRSLEDSGYISRVYSILLANDRSKQMLKAQKFA